MNRSSWSLGQLATIRGASHGVGLPFRCLSTSSVRVCLFGFFAQPHSAVRVLFTHCFPVREVSGSVDDRDECTDFWTVEGHVGEDAGCMGNVYGPGLCRHLGQEEGARSGRRTLLVVG